MRVNLFCHLIQQQLYCLVWNHRSLAASRAVGITCVLEKDGGKVQAKSKPRCWGVENVGYFVQWRTRQQERTTGKHLVYCLSSLSCFLFFFSYFSSLPVGLETSRRHIQLQNHEYLWGKEASGMERDTVKVGLARSSGATITTKILTSKENKSNKKPTV